MWREESYLNGSQAPSEAPVTRHVTLGRRADANRSRECRNAGFAVMDVALSVARMAKVGARFESRFAITDGAARS